MTITERPEWAAARAAMAAADVNYGQVRRWAVDNGWDEPDVRIMNPDAVTAYLDAHSPAAKVSKRPRAKASLEPPPSRFDELFSDPQFWRDLIVQCQVYAPQSPPKYAEALGFIAAGARALLALHEATHQESA